jgi:SAM-dependent methyltransferase
MVFDSPNIKGTKVAGKNSQWLGAASRRSLAPMIAQISSPHLENLISKHFTEKKGIEGMHLGCGSGEDVYLMASLLHESTTIDGIDSDPVLLEKARKNQRQIGKGQVHFFHWDSFDWQAPHPKEYDFIFTRFWASDFEEQEALLLNLHKRLKTEGILMGEILNFSGYSAYPYNHAFARSAELISRIDEVNGSLLDHWTGLFPQAGFRTIELNELPTEFITPSNYGILSLCLEAFMPRILQNTDTSREELNALLLELKEYEKQPDTLICRPGLLQIIARK